MNTNSENSSLFKQPSAWIPLVMSLTAFTMILAYLATFGLMTGTGDEGAPARIFQIIMLAEIPIGAYFAFRWLPQRPKQALLVLTLQAVAWIIPVATIIWLESL